MILTYVKDSTIRGVIVLSKEKVFENVIEKCRIYYGDSIISSEKIIECYMRFFENQFETETKKISFSFHTGSFCFDIASVVSAMLGCLIYDMSNNSDILHSLAVDDMVLYKGERYKWGGISLYQFSKNTPPEEYITLNQDAKGQNGASSIKMPLEKNKHLIKPYYGNSLTTDGRGVRKDRTNRNDFFSFILGIPESEVPSTIQTSIVIVSDKNEFWDICQNLKIEYSTDKSVFLTDLIPVTYYTSNGEKMQIGKNSSKAEAVIKVTSKLSAARDLVLDKHGNKVIGLLVINIMSLMSNTTELNDLLRRKSLKFAHVAFPYNNQVGEYVLDQYDDATVFACTKNLLETMQSGTVNMNKLTKDLNNQIYNIINRELHTINVQGCWSWEQYKSIKEKLYVIKQSNWSGNDKDNFVLSTIALLNLFTTSFFTIDKMEDAIACGYLSNMVISPKERINELLEIADRNISTKNICLDIISDLSKMYDELAHLSFKEKAFVDFLTENRNRKIAVVVPKAYYRDIFMFYFRQKYRLDNVDCITANKFDGQKTYDVVIAVGDISGKKFDPVQCFASSKIYIFLYDCERRTFNYRKKKTAKYERKLNARIRGLSGDEYIKAVSIPNDGDDIQDNTVEIFSDLDDFVENMRLFDVRKLIPAENNYTESGVAAEVKYVGTFTSGEQILFSKYYSAVVYNQMENKIEELSPDKLNEGDVLVFTNRDDYTKNIVDMIFEQLLTTQKLPSDVQIAAQKSIYWKDALRKYKEENNLTYRSLANQMKKLGESIQEVTVRQWLIPESHIVGPRKEKTMEIIANITKDESLLSDVNGYFEGCKVVRHYRREILSLIAQAINDKLRNKEAAPGSVFEVVYENVENLSKTMELENIFELDEVMNINNNLVNRPIAEMEALI